MELNVGTSTSQLQELQVSLQVYSLQKILLACIEVCEKNSVPFLPLFNNAKKPAPVSQFPTQDIGLISLPLKETKALTLPNQFNEQNTTPFTCPEGRKCPNGSQSNQQNAPTSGTQSSVPTNQGSTTQSYDSGAGPSGEPPNNPFQSNDPRKPGSGSDPPDPDSDPDPDPNPDEPDSDCPIGEPNCPICFYFEQRKIAIFGSKDGGRKSPDMELLFNEPIYTSQYQSNLSNMLALGSTSQQQQFVTLESSPDVPTTSASSSQLHQPIRTDVSQLSEENISSRSLLPNVGVVLPQSQSSPFNPEFKVPEVPTYQPKIKEPRPYSLPQMSVTRAPSATATVSPSQQLIESESSSDVPTVQAFSPQAQQPVHAYESRLHQQTPPSVRVDIPIVRDILTPSGSRSTSSESSLRVPKFTPSQPQSFDTPLQQLEYLVTGGPRASRFSSQLGQVVSANNPASSQKVRPQSETPRDTLLEPILKVPSVTLSQLQSMDTKSQVFGSPLQQLQYLTRRSPLDVPRALGFSPQSQQSVRANYPESYERIPSLKRPFTDVPTVRNILPQSSLSRGTSFLVPEIPVYQPEIKRRKIDSSQQFNVPHVSTSQLQSNIMNLPAFGSALQQQQYLAFGRQPNVPTARTTHTQIHQQPVLTYGSQLYERSPSLRRSSIDTPHTLTMLPRPNEPEVTSFQPLLKVPNVMFSRPRSTVINVPAFGSALQQQQSLSFGSQSNIPQSFRPQSPQARTFGSQLYQGSRSSVGSLSLPTSQPQSRISSTFVSPLEQLEFLASKGPKLSDFSSQIQQLVRPNDPELYDRNSSLAGSLTDVSNIRQTPRDSLRFEMPSVISCQPQPIISPQFRPASQQEVFLPFMRSTDLSTAPLFFSPTQQTKRSQQKTSFTRSLISVPNVRAVLPHSGEPKSSSDHGLKKKDPFSIASLLDLPDSRALLPQSEEPINPSLQQQSNVPKVPPSQPKIRKPTSHSLPQSDVPSFRLSTPQSRTADLPAFGFPLQQQQFLALGDQSKVPQTEALDPRFQQPVHVYGSRLYQQRPSSIGARFDVPRVLSQSSEPKYTSYEPQIRVPSAVSSRPQSNIMSLPAFGSALQQQQYLAFGSQPNVPTARTTHTQIHQQPVLTYGSQLYERTPLRRSLVSMPHTLTMLPQSNEPKDTSFEPSLKIPDVIRTQTQPSVANVPAFGSALQQQQYLAFGGQSNVPTARATYSQLQQPVRAPVSQLYGRSSSRRSSLNIPHTLTMLPQSNEPRYTSFEPQIRVPSVVFSQPQQNITSLPAFSSDLQQQQYLAFGAQPNIPIRQTLIPQLDRSSQSYGQRPCSVSSLFVRDVLPPSKDPKDTLVEPKFGEPISIPSQPPPKYATLPFGSSSQQQSLLPFGGQASVPATQYFSQPFQQNPSLVGPCFEAPNVLTFLPRVTSLEPKIFVPKVPAYRPQLNKPIALSLPYLDLPKVSTIGPQLKPHQESAFRAVTLQPRTDTIFDVGNLRGAGLPELRNRRTDLRFAESRPYPTNTK